MTQSVIMGVPATTVKSNHDVNPRNAHFASKQSIMLLNTSSLFLIEKLMKLVSTRI